ncbi:MAG: metalloregulator ArsR/SmtB family transcription factor [Coriobacteriaceae bacterium]|nr:metalloregulator ArsR/SmtB family transcription factor [Coriobacteriaceae bacterium]
MQIPPDEKISEAADLFKMFSDSTRMKIMYLLVDGEQNVTDLSERMEMSAPAISHHLRVLKAHNLVTVRKEGKESYYALADAHVTAILSIGMEHNNE